MKHAVSLFSLALLFSSCVVFRIGNLATHAILNDSDPELVEASLPAFIKTLEILYNDDPSNENNAKTLASMYLLYGNVMLGTKSFLLQNSDPLESSRISTRANHYALKAKQVIMPFVIKRSPKLFSGEMQLMNIPEKQAQQLVSMYTKKDTGLLYTAAASVFAVFSGNPLDFETANLLPAAILLVNRALLLDPYSENGRLLTLAYSVYAGMPETLGGNRNKALAYFTKAHEYFKETNAGIYIDYALLFALPENNKDAFIANINKAMSIAKAHPNLMNQLTLQKAQLILSDLYLYFSEP